MEIKGKVIQNLGLQTGTSKSGNPWNKAELIIETEGQYPKKIKLSNMKNAESFSLLPVGSLGTFQIELESREFNGRWYTDVTCWKWDIPHEVPLEVKMENEIITGGQKASYSDLGVPAKEKPSKEQTNDSDADLPF